MGICLEIFWRSEGKPDLRSYDSTDGKAMFQALGDVLFGNFEDYPEFNRVSIEAVLRATFSHDEMSEVEERLIAAGQVPAYDPANFRSHSTSDIMKFIADDAHIPWQNAATIGEFFENLPTLIERNERVRLALQQGIRDWLRPNLIQKPVKRGLWDRLLRRGMRYEPVYVSRENDIGPYLNDDAARFAEACQKAREAGETHAVLLYG